ncbi:hypothetical protein AAF712_011043 [Marasmius tenuissimus]|uniref:G3BP-like protein n=1 Tax=Marasmius tenuissimus TaxID=585030 RepID=A0ABR2ZM73_9AGAR
MNTNGPATVVPSEVGWQFVPQYYAFINKEPERLHCFYSKQSVFSHGTEGEEVKTCNGQQEIHGQITALGFQDCKIFVHSVESQASLGGGIIIQVIGELSNAGEPWRKFVQTFFLAEQPNGYFVLNDIFRFLKEDSVEGDEGDSAEAESTQAPEVPEAAPAEVAAPVEPPREPTPPPAVEATPVPVEEPPTTVSDVPETESAPAEPVTQLNGVHPESDKLSAQAAPTTAPSTEKPKSPAPPPAAAASPAPAAPTPPPQTTPSAQPAAPAQPPAAAAAAAPPPQAAPQPAAAPVPKTWANLAAANSKKWGAAVAQESRGTTEVVPSSPASGSQTPQAPGTPVSASGRQGGRSPHPAYQAAQSVTIPHCFIKNVSENITEPALKQALQRYGTLKHVEIVRHKACAFAEFTSVDAAKRAIIASLTPNAGGEGGVKVEVPGTGPVKIVVETKKERGDRPVSNRGRGGPPFGDGRGGGAGGSGAGGDRGSFRGRGGRGRGNATK